MISISLLIWFLVLVGILLSSYFAMYVMRANFLTKASGNRSQCDHTGDNLKWFELVPVLSYLWLRGRSRYSGESIDIRIFLSELLALILMTLYGVGNTQLLSTAPFDWQFLLQMLINYVLILILLYLGIYDLFTLTIPSFWLSAMTIVAVGINTVSMVLVWLGVTHSLPWGNWDNLVMSILAGLAVWLLIHITHEKGLGQGDLYLLVNIGLLLGYPALISASYVVIFAATGVGLLLALRRRRFKGQIIPLVPFIAIGFTLSAYWGIVIFNSLFPFL